MRMFVVALIMLSAGAVFVEVQAAGAEESVATQPVASTQDAAATQSISPAKRYEEWVLAPAVVAILLAILLRQVVPALALGVLVGAAMMHFHDNAGTIGLSSAIAIVRLATEQYFIGALTDVDHMKIIVFTSLIGGLVGVMGVNGGTAALVRAVVGYASTRARGMLSTWFAGLVVFFDDYANAMIIGPSMRPIADRLRISRAKLAYLVDSTAAPVASIAIIGTWIGFEVDAIQGGLNSLEQPPAFLDGVSGYGAFLESIPYRFYPILALVFVFLVALLGRDFGPMLSAERDAASASREPEPAAGGTTPNRPAHRSVWLALGPLLVLIGVTLAVLFATGAAGIADDTSRTWVGYLREVVSNADSYNSILYGALAGVVCALLLTLVARAATLREAVDGGLDGAARLMPTFVVLALAWALSGVMQDLQLGEFAAALLQASSFEPTWLPLLIFLSSCVVSFATGTSWGTMTILCPVAVTLSAQLLVDLPTDEALPLFYASVGGVLAGAVFGDHCSPISDTTVLSSLATECRLEVHVWTQAPYALLVGAVGIVAGDVVCRAYGQPLWVGYLGAIVALLLILLALGRRAQPRV